MDIEKIEGITTIAIKALVSVGVIGTWLYLVASGNDVAAGLDTAAKLVMGAVFGTALSAGLSALRRRF